MSQVTKTRTYSNGSQMTATNYNDDRDEIIAGVNNIDNTQIIAGANIAASKIAGTAATLAGTETLTNKTISAGTLSGATSFTGSWSSSTQPRCRIKKSATQSISNVTFTTITFDQEDFDVGAMHDNSTNNSRITIPASEGGVYLIVAQVQFTLNATGGRSLAIFLNGSSQIAYSTIVGSSHDDNVLVSTNISALNAGDYLEIRVYQSSGAALLVKTEHTKFQAFKLA